MHKTDLIRVKFYSIDDMAGGYQLKKAEHILREDIVSNYEDINDILELYNIKKYLDKEIYLKDWSQNDIANFKQRASVYGKVVSQFFSTIDDNNFIDNYGTILNFYENSFWELVNNQDVFKRISKAYFSTILSKDPHVLYSILPHKKIVEHYNIELKNFMLSYSLSAEILLSFYEIKDDFGQSQRFLPKSLTVEDKEIIISKYLDSNDVNYNYIEIIQNARNRDDFKISDKTRLKAKRLHKNENEKLFSNESGMKYGVSVHFPENAAKVIDVFIDDKLVTTYSYSLSFIKQNKNPYSLFRNFKMLFEYIDNQNRITLFSKKNQMSVLESIMGVHPHNEYRGGIVFDFLEMTSHAQIVGYNYVLNSLSISLESILHHVFTSSFHEKYEFANNARFSIPSSTSYFEKVRLLAPEFESVLKQFKLFVEEGSIDFELLQISSSPMVIKNIPSLNSNKYIYFNEENKEMVGCLNLFFSDQSPLCYIEPFKDKDYRNFYDLLANEQVKFSYYKEYQKPELIYLIKKGLISIDIMDFIEISNPARVEILHDLYYNEFASFYHYPFHLRQEAQQMESEKIVFFEGSLFAKPEQAYFNYYLNKSEFTNGLDLRNSYLHGTQATPDEIQAHEYAYFTYLKLLILTFLKIEDDLVISKVIESRV